MTKKLCINCKYVVKPMDHYGSTDKFYSDKYYCKHPDLADVVTGLNTLCFVNRHEREKCNIEGKYWEENE